MKTKSAATEASVKKIAKKQYKLTASEANVLSVWMEDAANFSSVPSKLAEKLSRDVENVRKDLKSLATKGVLSPIPKQGKYQLYQLSKEILALAGDTEVVTKSAVKAPITNSTTTPPVYSPTAVLSPISNYGQVDSSTQKIMDELSAPAPVGAVALPSFDLTLTQQKELESFNAKASRFLEVKDFPLPYFLGNDISKLERNILDRAMSVSPEGATFHDGETSVSNLSFEAMKQICSSTLAFSNFFLRDIKIPDKQPPVLFAFHLKNNSQLIAFVANVLQKHFLPTEQKYATGWNKRIYDAVVEFSTVGSIDEFLHISVFEKQKEESELSLLRQALRECENAMFECQANAIKKYKHRASLLNEKEQESFNELLPKAESFLVAPPVLESKEMSPEAEALFQKIYGTK